MTNLTLGQKIAMALVFLSAIAGGTSQLSPIMGQGAATAVASLASLLATVVSGWMFIVTGQQGLVTQIQNTTGGQGALVRSVLDMGGVEKIEVNKNASPELAQMAVDPDVDKISPIPGAQRAVEVAATKVS